LRKFGEDVYSAQNVSGVFDFFPCYWGIEQYDTLYHIDVKRNILLPFFTMKYNFELTKDKNVNKPHFVHLNKNLVLAFVVTLTSEGLWSFYEIIAIDLKNKTSSWVNVKNDYMGNVDVLKHIFYEKFHKGYYAFTIQPEDLMEDIEKRLAERTCTEADREILKVTLSKLKEGTNNVLFIGKLKDEITTKLW
jgi:hypothetical protein